MPAYEQLRIVTEQKYPRQGDAAFRTPYYKPSLQAIRRFYQEGNNARVLAAAKRQVSDLRPDAKRIHNRRVLDSFEGSAQYTRDFEVRPGIDAEATIGDVVVRLSADLFVHEDGVPKVLFYNLRTVQIPSEVARSTIEIAHWILEQNDIDLPVRSIEYIDLAEPDRRVHTIGRRRKQTIQKLKRNAHVIQALWGSV